MFKCFHLPITLYNFLITLWYDIFLELVINSHRTGHTDSVIMCSHLLPFLLLFGKEKPSGGCVFVCVYVCDHCLNLEVQEWMWKCKKSVMTLSYWRLQWRGSRMYSLLEFGCLQGSNWREAKYLHSVFLPLYRFLCCLGCCALPSVSFSL